MITIRQLEIFAAVTRHGSFRQCADHLGMSQVSISEHIRALEDRLGRKLFERRPGGPATLTEDGQLALVRINAILSDIGDFVSEMGGGLHDGTRRVTIAMHAFLMRNLHDRLRQFELARPELDLKLDIGDHLTPELLEKVANRRVDLAYIYAGQSGDAPGTTYLRDEHLAIYVGPDHPLQFASPASATDLREIPGIFLSARNPLRILIDQALASVGIAGGPIDVETDDYGLLLHSVRRNQGFACMFLAAEQELALSSGFKKIELQTPLPPLQVRLATRRTSADDAFLQELKKLIGDADTSSG
jgi:molybdate transport repressor ModE-like protein